MKPTVLKLNWPDKSKLSRNAFGIIRTLHKAGFEAFIAGGAVRDALLKRPIRELDIATSAKPNQVEKLFEKTIPTGKKHGTVTVRKNAMNYEVTTFRVEGSYRRSRWPEAVKFVSSASEDAKRRDFTINALFYDVKRGVVLDYVNGIADLSHQSIALVGDPNGRIREDALRMLRAVRFATVLKYSLSRETRKAIQKNAKLISKISSERIKQELDRIMLSDRSSIGVGLLDIVGLLQYILPEVKDAQGVGQPKNQHSEGDVYTHSLLALEQIDGKFDLSTRYAVLFHDLGKKRTRKIRNGKITFYDHQVVGANLSEKICHRLKFGASDTKKISWLVKYHLVPYDFAKMKLSTRRKWGLSPYFRDLLFLYLADVRASLPPSGKPVLNPLGYKVGLNILKELETKPILRKPLISGIEVMRVLKVKEGPLVGKILKIIEEKKLANKLRNKNEALRFLKDRGQSLLRDLP